jgi:hypothetical protein
MIFMSLVNLKAACRPNDTLRLDPEPGTGLYELVAILELASTQGGQVSPRDAQRVVELAAPWAQLAAMSIPGWLAMKYANVLTGRSVPMVQAANVL